MMGARNTMASLSPLHAEIEAFIRALESMRNLRQFHAMFATDCSQLVKMVSEPIEWTAYPIYLEDIWILRESFNHSEIIHVLRTQKKSADNLPLSFGKQSSFVVNMDAELPRWFEES